MKILWTGDRGFIAGYSIQKLLDEGHTVIGIDNNWKYGKVEKSYDNHKNYHHFYGNAKSKLLLKALCSFYKPDIMVCGAALIGGISFFHEFAYDLYSENEKICSTFFDVAIEAYQRGDLKKVVAISSSMVYESADTFPSIEGDERKIPPPLSTYGFQKLSVEYFCQGAHEQYNLPYTIIRPFNCGGIGETRAKADRDVYSGNIKLALSHVIPDLIQKVLKGQDPLHILGDGNQIRYYTYGGDIAEGIYRAIISDKALNEDFNISTNIGHSVLEVAQKIWERVNPTKEFSYISDKAYKYDVQKRIPSTDKAKELLGFEARTSLDRILDETIPWITKMMEKNKI